MARRIAGVVALALLSMLVGATCTADYDFNAWAERNPFQLHDTLGTDAVAKMCYLELKGDFCAGSNRDALNALCSKDCKDHDVYTSGGLCSDVTNTCICQKPCAAEKTTDARNPAPATDKAANADAGDLMSYTMAESVPVI